MEEHEANQEMRETMKELSELLLVVQEMGYRLSMETQGESYAVRELNELLRRARLAVELLEQTGGAGVPDTGRPTRQDC